MARLWRGADRGNKKRGIKRSTRCRARGTAREVTTNDRSCLSLSVFFSSRAAHVWSPRYYSPATLSVCAACYAWGTIATSEPAIANSDSSRRHLENLADVPRTSRETHDGPEMSAGFPSGGRVSTHRSSSIFRPIPWTFWLIDGTEIPGTLRNAQDR